MRGEENGLGDVEFAALMIKVVIHQSVIQMGNSKRPDAADWLSLMSAEFLRTCSAQPRTDLGAVSGAALDEILTIMKALLKKVRGPQSKRILGPGMSVSQ